MMMIMMIMIIMITINDNNNNNQCCLVKVSGCPDLLPGSLDLIPWLPGGGSWLLVQFLVSLA